MKAIYLVVAILALSLFVMVAGEFKVFSGLSIDARREIGLVTFVANLGIGLYGAIRFHRIAWSAYLVFSVVGLLLLSASTPIVALWLALKLL